jgi:hypothetical protein
MARRIERRKFLAALCGAAVLWSLAARAQQLGILGATSLRPAEGFLNARSTTE